MKRASVYLAILVILSSFILMQCKDKPTQPDTRELIYGGWLLEHSRGGIANLDIFADSADYSRGFIFGKRMVCEEIYNDTVRFSGPYVFEDSISPNGETLLLISITTYYGEADPLKWIVDYADEDSLIVTEDREDAMIFKFNRFNFINLCAP